MEKPDSLYKVPRVSEIDTTLYPKDTHFLRAKWETLPAPDVGEGRRMGMTLKEREADEYGSMGGG